jgi:hypothetical protein
MCFHELHQHLPIGTNYIFISGLQINSIHFQYTLGTKPSDFSNFCGVIGYNFFLL